MPPVPPVVTPVSVLAGGQLLCGGAKAETEKLRSSVSQQRAATRHTGHQEAGRIYEAEDSQDF